jgi:hypothetical protein
LSSQCPFTLLMGRTMKYLNHRAVASKVMGNDCPAGAGGGTSLPGRGDPGAGNGRAVGTGPPALQGDPPGLDCVTLVEVVVTGVVGPVVGPLWGAPEAGLPGVAVAGPVRWGVANGVVAFAGWWVGDAVMAAWPMPRTVRS